MRRELERIEIPGEHEARERSWAVVRAAFAEREPTPRRRSWKPLVAVAVALVVVAGLLSPPGRAVLDEIREVVGVEESAPALFSLPAPGRLLVTADSGAWVVERGRLEAASRRLPRSVVVAVRPLRRRGAAQRARRARRPTARCAGRSRGRTSASRAGAARGRTRGSPTSRAARCASSAATARATALLDAQAAARAPRWRPGERRTCSCTPGGTGRPRGRRRHGRRARAQGAGDARCDEETALRTRCSAGRDVDTPVRSPDGRWLAVGWPEADQLVFVRTGGGRQIRAVSNVSAQFRSRSFPTISGWCCAP